MIGGVIFIGGVHGAGKGTLAKQVSEATGLLCFSASELIKERKQAPVDHQKNVIDADRNQDFLVSAVLDKLAIHKSLILDGHFTLWSANEILPISESIFHDLSIRALILISVRPETVAARLSYRDRHDRPVEQLTEAIKAEENRAKEIQMKLNVPMLTVSSGQCHQVGEWLEQLQGRS